jgi:hypothetical protein
VTRNGGLVASKGSWKYFSVVRFGS